MTRQNSSIESERLIRDATLLSETDTFGTILFVNDDFCKVAKYEREELIGKPHNIIRHPDMPKKLFAFLWNTIQAGNVFRGIIKNKAKDNSHYWVQAIIMPILDKDQKIIKYLGVRHHIKDNVYAEELYRSQLKEFELQE
jgi:PAS domain S-box-containing protein